MRILFQINRTNQQRQLEKLVWIFPIKLAMYATALRNQGNEIIWDGRDDGSFKRVITSESQIDIPFLKLPSPDRLLTDALNRKWSEHGNYKYLPGTHILSASGCSHGACTFCVENKKPYEVRPVEDVINEIEECKSLGFKEVFDDSATLPVGGWLNSFCNSVSHIKIRLGGNTRIGSSYDFRLMRNAGFRMCLFGIESASQLTLDKINKGVKVEDIIPTLKRASECGLEPHIAGMVGYPWESEEDCLRTVKLFRYLLSRGYAKTAQMSFYCPPLDQEQGNKQHLKYLRGMYYVAFNPLLWYKKVIEIKNMEDFNYLIRSIKEGWRGIWGRRN